MSNVNDGESDDELTERGMIEKDKVSKTIFKKKRAELESFFQGYRGFVKMENANHIKLSHTFDARQELFYILIHELEKTLTASQRDHLVKKWKPVIPPIILIGDPDQLYDIRSYINSRDMSRINIDKEKQKPDLRISEEHSNNDVFGAPSFFAENATILPTCVSNIEEGMYQEHSRLDAEFMNNECNGFVYRDLVENVANENIGTPSIDELYLRLSLAIDQGENVQSMLNDLKTHPDIDTYCGVISFIGGDQEPILFQLVLDVNRYESALDMLRADGMMILCLRNIRNLSIFSFLLLHGLEKLHRFLVYSSSRNLANEVRNVCCMDNYFKKELSKLKGDPSCSIQQLRSVERFCFFN